MQISGHMGSHQLFEANDPLVGMRIATVAPSSGSPAAVSAVDPTSRGRLGPKPWCDRLQQPFIVE